MRKNSEDESTIFERLYLIHHSHFDFEVVEDGDQVEAKLCHGWVDKICGEVFRTRLLARKSHVEEYAPVPNKNLEVIQ